MTDSLPRVIADTPLAPAILKLLDGKVTWLPWDTFSSTAVEAEAVYTFGHPELNGEMLDRISGLRVISNYGVGVDHINLDDAAQRGIPVGNTPEILNGATADMGFALLLAAARRVVEGDRYARSPEFTVYDPAYMLGVEVHSTTLGIIGLGRIGREVAKRARAFGMRILYHNRRPIPDEAEVEASYAELDSLLSAADFVLLSCPLSPETRHLIGEKELKQMKSTAILVNIARGPVVDSSALATALAERWIYGAGIDVTDPEPLPRDHPLLGLDNLVVCPHLGSATEQTRQKMAEISVENLLVGLQGKRLRHEVKT